jgi:tetratricopeptide (TPR) repeat protein
VQWFKTAAEMLKAENRPEEACNVFAYIQPIASRDTSVSSRILAGEIAQRMVDCVGDDPVARLAALRSACAADTTNRVICTRYASESEKAGYDSSALQVYTRFAKVDSNDIPTWESVSRVGRRLNAQDAVLRGLRQLARLEPNNPERTAALVDELFARGRVDQGFAVLVPKLRDYPGNAHLLYLAGSYYSRLPSDSDKRTALEYLDRAVIVNDPAWKSQALSLHDGIERPLTDEEINQVQFFGRRIARLHCCRIPGREKQNQLPGMNCP